MEPDKSMKLCSTGLSWPRLVPRASALPNRESEDGGCSVFRACVDVRMHVCVYLRYAAAAIQNG